MILELIFLLLVIIPIIFFMYLVYLVILNLEVYFLNDIGESLKDLKKK